MLGAGVWAPGKVNVHRQIKGDFFVEIIGERQRVALGIGLRELAVGVSRAGDEPAAEV